MTITLRSGQIAQPATDASDQVVVSVPNLTLVDRAAYGPYRFTPKINAARAVVFPERGDRALIAVVDDNQDGPVDWLVSWSRADSGPASPAPAGAIFVRKPTNETVANSNTLQDDDDLGAPVAANSVYKVDAWIHWSSPTTPGIKFGWTAPAGSTLDWSNYDPADVNYTLASVMTRSGGVVHRVLPLSGLLVVGGTAGTLRLQWAQNTANGSSTAVYANSWLRAEKVS